MAVRQQFTGDASQLNRELERTQQQYARLEEQLQRLQQQSQQAGQEATESANNQVSALDGLVVGATAAAGAYVTVAAAVESINQALERQQALRGEALTETERLGAAFEQLRATGQFESQADLLQFRQQVIAAGADAPDIVAFTEAVTASVSALGSEQRGTALESVRQAQRIGRLQQPDFIQAVAGGAGDIAAATGATPEASVGFLTQVLGQARQVDVAEVGRALPTAIAGAIQVAPEQDPTEAAEEASAVFTLFSSAQGVFDPRGPTAAVAASNFLQRVENVFAGRDDDPGTLFGRIEAIRADEGLRRQFTEDLELGRARPVSRALVDPSRGTFAELQRREAALDLGAGGAARVGEIEAQLTPEIAIGQREAARRGAEQRRRLFGPPEEVAAAEATRELEVFRERVGLGVAEEALFFGARQRGEIFREQFGPAAPELQTLRDIESTLVQRRERLRRPPTFEERIFDPQTPGERDEELREVVRQIALTRGTIDRIGDLTEQAAASAAQAQPQRHHEN